MSTIPSVQLFRNSEIISGRDAAITALKTKKKFVADGGLILATYSGDKGVKTLLGIVRNSGGANAQVTIIDVEGAAANVQNAIDALSAYTNTKLTEEKNAREAADTTLQNNINALSLSTDTKINAEVTRATGKEEELASTITSNYTTLSTAIDDEKKRAEAKESDLDAKIQALDGSLDDTVSSTVASGEYSSTDKAIHLKNANGETLSTIDATAFIKDGMVTSASVVGENLVITFNTDAGHEDILIPISDIFNAENYYTKTEINALSADTKSKIDAEIAARVAADATLQTNIDTLSSSTDKKIADEATARTKADKELADKLGTGVTTAEGKTVTEQLQALSGRTGDASGITSVEGAKAYAKDLVDNLNAEVGSTTGTSKTEAIKIVQAHGKIDSITLGAFDCGTY